MSQLMNRRRFLRSVTLAAATLAARLGLPLSSSQSRASDHLTADERRRVISSKPILPSLSLLILILSTVSPAAAQQGLQALTRQLQTEDATDRGAAAEALGRLADPRAIADLRRSLQDPDEGVRARSIIALSRLQDRASIPAFVAVLRDGGSRAERWAAIVALGRLEARQAIGDLEKLARDGAEDPKTRGVGVAALAAIDAERATETALVLAADGSPTVRFHAAIALERAAGKDSLEALFRMLRNREEESFIRIRAAWSIAAHRDPQATARLRQAAREEREFIAFHIARAMLLSGLPGGREAAVELKAAAQDPFIQQQLGKLLGASK